MEPNSRLEGDSLVFLGIGRIYLIAQFLIPIIELASFKYNSYKLNSFCLIIVVFS